MIDFYKAKRLGDVGFPRGGQGDYVNVDGHVVMSLDSEATDPGKDWAYRPTLSEIAEQITKDGWLVFAYEDSGITAMLTDGPRGGKVLGIGRGEDQLEAAVDLYLKRAS